MPIPHPRRGIWRWLFKAPIWLYRLRLGWLLGRRFLLLEHRGRKSGRLYRTVLEVIGHEPTSETYYVIAGFGKRSDWLLNVQAHPQVTITVGTQHIPARARVLAPQEGARVLGEFARRYPKEVEMLARAFGYPSIRTEQEMLSFVEEHPVVALMRQT